MTSPFKKHTIILIILRHFNVLPDDIKSSRPEKNAMLARNLICYFLKANNLTTDRLIKEEFGGGARAGARKITHSMLDGDEEIINIVKHFEKIFNETFMYIN